MLGIPVSRAISDLTSLGRRFGASAIQESGSCISASVHHDGQFSLVSAWLIGQSQFPKAQLQIPVPVPVSTALLSSLLPFYFLFTYGTVSFGSGIILDCSFPIPYPFPFSTLPFFIHPQPRRHLASPTGSRLPSQRHSTVFHLAIANCQSPPEEAHSKPTSKSKIHLSHLTPTFRITFLPFHVPRLPAAIAAITPYVFPPCAHLPISIMRILQFRNRNRKLSLSPHWHYLAQRLPQFRHPPPTPFFLFLVGVGHIYSPASFRFFSVWVVLGN